MSVSWRLPGSAFSPETNKPNKRQSLCERWFYLLPSGDHGSTFNDRPAALTGRAVLFARALTAGGCLPVAFLPCFCGCSVERARSTINPVWMTDCLSSNTFFAIVNWASVWSLVLAGFFVKLTVVAR
jgi:hypothetical protein